VALAVAVVDRQAALQAGLETPLLLLHHKVTTVETALDLRQAIRLLVVAVAAVRLPLEQMQVLALGATVAREPRHLFLAVR